MSELFVLSFDTEEAATQALTRSAAWSTEGRSTSGGGQRSQSPTITFSI